MPVSEDYPKLRNDPSGEQLFLLLAPISIVTGVGQLPQIVETEGGIGERLLLLVFVKTLGQFIQG